VLFLVVAVEQETKRARTVADSSVTFRFIINLKFG
jgi:hypothetical protein